MKITGMAARWDCSDAPCPSNQLTSRSAVGRDTPSTAARKGMYQRVYDENAIARLRFCHIHV